MKQSILWLPTPFAVAALTAALIQAPLALATTAESRETDTWQWSGHVEAGYQYDSNVNIVELDNNTNQGDGAKLLRAELQANWTPVADLRLKLGGQHSRQSYDDFTAFDLAITTLSADLSYAFDIVTVGVSQHQADARLASAAFLDYRQQTVYLAKLWNNSWYTRAEWQNIDKEFAEFSQRDAQATVYSGDVYWFNDDATAFINVGYNSTDEQAVEPSLSYRGEQLRLKWQFSSDVWGAEQQWQLGWQLQQRDYYELQPDTDTVRSEQRHSLFAQWQIPLSSALQLTPRVEYVDNRSNLDSADYQETLAGVTLRFSF